VAVWLINNYGLFAGTREEKQRREEVRHGFG
jgi:hypothetical protein